jgi:hypothetical protein
MQPGEIPLVTPRELPAWERFAAEDRYRVVTAILQVARRQVEIGPRSTLLER